MKNLLFLVVLLLSFPLSAEDTAEVVVRIKRQDSGVELFRESDNLKIPSVAATKEIEEKLKNLESGSEAIVKGQIIYQGSQVESATLKPVFVIHTILPISLKMIGKVENTPIPDRVFDLNPPQYSPQGFPISTQVASAITLTSATLLMQSLTSNPNTPHAQQALDTGMIVFAGALATGYFIYKQVTE